MTEQWERTYKWRGQQRTMLERWESKVSVAESGCWLWTGTVSPQGYGRLSEAGNPDGVSAHRFAYETFIGPVPLGLELDHLCRTRLCVNPNHLEAVTHQENVHRGAAPTIRLHLAGVCQRGHSLAEHGCRRRSTGYVVYCRACRREAHA